MFILKSRNEPKTANNSTWNLTWFIFWADRSTALKNIKYRYVEDSSTAPVFVFIRAFRALSYWPYNSWDFRLFSFESSVVYYVNVKVTKDKVEKQQLILTDSQCLQDRVLDRLTKCNNNKSYYDVIEVQCLKLGFTISVSQILRPSFCWHCCTIITWFKIVRLPRKISSTTSWLLITILIESVLRALFLIFVSLYVWNVGGSLSQFQHETIVQKPTQWQGHTWRNNRMLTDICEYIFLTN